MPKKKSSVCCNLYFTSLFFRTPHGDVALRELRLQGPCLAGDPAVLQPQNGQALVLREVAHVSRDSRATQLHPRQRLARPESLHVPDQPFACKPHFAEFGRLRGHQAQVPFAVQVEEFQEAQARREQRAQECHVESAPHLRVYFRGAQVESLHEPRIGAHRDAAAPLSQRLGGVPTAHVEAAFRHGAFQLQERRGLSRGLSLRLRRASLVCGRPLRHTAASCNLGRRRGRVRWSSSSI
mmetsp:Transcript_72980/g.137626  ORF Transcript_72980/g.137626 Transcript_72980/m.137626 type:complete len:238 (+) Transcript_72980:108-821(+)